MVTGRERRFVLVGALMAVAGCRQGATAPQVTPSGCTITAAIVQVVMVYVKDPTQMSQVQNGLAQTPLLTWIGHLSAINPTNTVITKMTNVDLLTWTVTIGVVPDSGVLTHGAVANDPGFDPFIHPSFGTASGLTANGVQVKRVIGGTGSELGYFGVDPCGKIYVD